MNRPETNPHPFCRLTTLALFVLPLILPACLPAQQMPDLAPPADNDDQGGGGAATNPPTSTRPPFFRLPLTIAGRPAGNVVIDTGKCGELTLREDFGLDIVDQSLIFTFTGPTVVGVSAPFPYTVGQTPETADFALIDPDPDAPALLGSEFFLDAGLTLALHFPTTTADFITAVPDDAFLLPFTNPSPSIPLDCFAWTEITITTDRPRTRLGIFDTGANVTALRCADCDLPPDEFVFREVTLEHPTLGAVTVEAVLFDEPSLPDLIIGLDAMRAWAPRWFFTFTEMGGAAAVAY